MRLSHLRKSVFSIHESKPELNEHENFDPVLDSKRESIHEMEKTIGLPKKSSTSKFRTRSVPKLKIGRVVSTKNKTVNVLEN